MDGPITTAALYLRENFQPDDRIAIMLLNREKDGRAAASRGSSHLPLWHRRLSSRPVRRYRVEKSDVVPEPIVDIGPVEL
jgi:hypothetical protein